MTVQSDMQQAVASCQAAKGSYAVMANSTEDQQAKQKFNQMSTEMEEHIQFLNDRLNYLNENNMLNN